MRILVFHPWGRFDPRTCGASRLAFAQLEYFQSRGWDVHVVVQEIPAWGLLEDGFEELESRFSCIASIRKLRLECAPVAPRRYGDEFCSLLYAGERAARKNAYQRIAREEWDAFYTTDAAAAPFALVMCSSVWKVLSACDSHSRRAATTELVPTTVREFEANFSFQHIESELYTVFDQVLFNEECDAARAEAHGVAARVCIPQALPTHSTRMDFNTTGEHDIFICGGLRSGELADIEWFYRHVYLPHLRMHGIRLTLTGPVAERFPVADLRVAKLRDTIPPYEMARVVVAPACEAAGPCVPVLDALAAGRAVVTTPQGMRGLRASNVAAVIDMRRDPAAVASVIRDRLSSTEKRRTLGERAKEFINQHALVDPAVELDQVWRLPARGCPVLEAA